MQIKGFYRWLYRKHRSDGLIDGNFQSDGITIPSDGNELMDFLFFNLMEMVMEYAEPMHCLFCDMMEIY